MLGVELTTKKEIIEFYTEDRPTGGGLTLREKLLLERIRYMGRDMKLNWLKSHRRRKGR